VQHHTPRTSCRSTDRGNGRHSLGFTTGRFPDPLQITPHNYEITEHACRKCHTEITDAIDLSSHGGKPSPVTTAGGEDERPRANEELACVKCHRDVGHAVR
jgi:cytochrome c nitrite reductase small subunit